jgi:hypothetical protein
MTDTRSRHVPFPVMGQEAMECRFCNLWWPCDAIREADRADKAEAALAECHLQLTTERQTFLALSADEAVARADAKALAEALDMLLKRIEVEGRYVNLSSFMEFDVKGARAALAAHKEATDD